MKVRDIKEVIEFLNKDGMDVVKRSVLFINDNCPDDVGLKKDSCKESERCFECWARSLELEENKDKLENEI